MSWELTGIPYTSARDPGGIGDAIKVLRGLGLAERLGDHGVADAGDLELLPPSGERGPSGLLNEAGGRSWSVATVPSSSVAWLRSAVSEDS